MVPLPAHGRIHTCREFTLFFLKLLRICYSRSFFFFKICLFLAVLGSLLLLMAFCSCSDRGLLYFGVWTSHRGGCFVEEEDGLQGTWA